MSQIKKKQEEWKALRLFAEEIERKIAHLFLLLNSAQDRLEELMVEECTFPEESDDSSQTKESESERSSGEEDSPDTDFQKCFDLQKKWDRIKRPNILRARKIPEKSGNKK